MESEFIPRAIPRVKIALYGPSGVGKTLFANVLLQGNIIDTQPTTEPKILETLREYKRVTTLGTVESVEKYRLTLVDVPGADDLVEERKKALQKVIGWLFMYDTTDPQSAKKLYDMIKKELAEERKLKSAIGVMVVGTKADLGVNPETTKIAEEIVDFLSKNTMASIYGYKIPHVQISCMNAEQVKLTYLCLESIVFDLRPSPMILKKLMEAPKPTKIEAPKPAEKIPEKKQEIILKEDLEITKKEEIIEKPEDKVAIAPSTPPKEKSVVSEKAVEEIKSIEKISEQESVSETKEQIEIPELPKEVPSEIPLPEPPKIEIGEKIEEQKLSVPPKEEIKPRPTPKAKVKVDREKIRESIKVLVETAKKEKPTIREEPISIESSKNKELLKILTTISENKELRDVYILEHIDKNKWAVAYDVTNIVLNEKKIEFLSSIINLYTYLNKTFSSGAYLIALSDKLALVLPSKNNIVLLELSPKNISEALSLLLSTETSDMADVDLSSIGSGLNLKIKMDNDPNVWDLARRLRWLSPDIESVMIIRSDKDFLIAHDGGRYVSDYHKAVVKLFSDLVRRFAEKKPWLLLTIGKRSIIMILGENAKKALVFVIHGKVDPSLISMIISAAS